MDDPKTYCVITNYLNPAIRSNIYIFAWQDNKISLPKVKYDPGGQLFKLRS